MNKKDFSSLRRQFKTDSNYLKLSWLYTVYVKKEDQSILHAELASMDMMEDSEKEIYLGNFKKLLTGSIDNKVFELAFDSESPSGDGQSRCLELLGSDQEAFADCCDKFIEQIAANYNYESDVVISFVKGKYNKPFGKKAKPGEEEPSIGFDEITYGFQFVMCSVSKVDSVKKNIYYSAATRKFEISSSLDKQVNYSSPLDGFMFPAFSDNSSDVNKLIYYTSKPNTLNEELLTNVLGCRYVLTAKEEQEKFESLLRAVNGDKIKPEIMKNIYDVINEKIQEQEDSEYPATLDATTLKDIFQECGIENIEKFDDTFSQTAENGFEFKAQSVIPSGSAVKISTGAAEISISREELGAVRQVINSRGRKCLQIELSEDAIMGSFMLETEHI